MKAVGVVFVLLALGAIVVLALWPYERSDAKRRESGADARDSLTTGLFPDAGGEASHHGHHGDHGSGNAGEDGGPGDSGGHGGH